MAARIPETRHRTNHALAARWFLRLAVSASLVAPTCALARTTNVDKGDTAWMLVATLLVVLMIVPGLALFYGGLVRRRPAARSASAVRCASAARAAWPDSGA